jgi:hypothetical protein
MIFRRLPTFFSTARDVGRFERLIKELGAPRTVAGLLGKRSNDVLEEFAALLAPRDGIAAVLEHHGYAGPAGRAKLVDLYRTLLAGGAGQWVGTTYIPAAALYDPNLLALLLKAQADGANPTVVAITALDYIERKETALRGKKVEQAERERAQQLVIARNWVYLFWVFVAVGVCLILMSRFHLNFYISAVAGAVVGYVASRILALYVGMILGRRAARKLKSQL